MTTETRFKDLNSFVPAGSFYDSIGNVIPYRSDNTQLRLVTEFPNTTFRILINDIDNGLVTTDANGNAIFSVQLPLGDIILELQQEASTNKIVTYLTTKDYSVWHAGLAEQLELIDDRIESTLKSFKLAKAESEDIDLAHGVRLLTPNEFSAGLETYRDILQFMRQAFRQFGGRLSGKYAIVAAITQVNPLIFFRNFNAPRWVLGYNRLSNSNFSEAYRPLDGTDLATQINVAGSFVTLVSGDAYVNTGTGVLSYFKNFKRFIWTPPDVLQYVPSYINARKYDTVEIDVDDRYIITSNKIRAFLDSKHGTGANPYSLNVRDRLYLNIDNRGIFSPIFNYEFTLDRIIGCINAYILNSGHYYQSMFVSIQPTGTLADYIEVILVSDYTILNSTDPGATTGVGTVDSDGVGNLRYQSPGDTSFGAYKSANLGGSIRLFSGNGVDYVDIFTAFTTPPANSDTFTIQRRYFDIVEKLSSNDKFRINSGNRFVPDGESNIEILDGPWSKHTDIFGLSEKKANISQPVTAGDIEIEVPAGTMEDFNSVNGSVNLPFNIILGRGEGPDTTTFEITPSSGNVIAKVENISGLSIKNGYTHARFVDSDGETIRSSMNGIYKISDIDELNNEFWLYNFSGSGVQEIATAPTMTGVYNLGIDPRVQDNGTHLLGLVISGSNKLLHWRVQGSAAYGPLEDVSSGGYFRLYSDTDYKWLDVLVVAGSLPGVNTVSSFYNRRGFFIKTLGQTGKITLWSSGEKATVTEVTPNGGTETWKLKNPVAGNYGSAGGPYEVLPFAGSPPISFTGEDTFGNLELDVDVSEEPPTINSSANIVVGNPKLPASWKDVSTVPADYTITPEAKYNKGAILINDSSNDIVFDQAVLFGDEDRGFLFTFKVWVRNVAPDGHSLEFKLGFDFGTSIVESSAIVVTDPDDTVQYPQMLEFSQILPPDASQFRVRIRRTTGGSGPHKAIVERAVLIKEHFDSLYLGDGTVPRSGGRSNFGSLFYVWSPEELSTNEKNILGIDAPSLSGLIRNIHNAHEQVDAFDVTDVASGNVVNVRGVIDESGWLTTTLNNLEIVSGSPSRFSFVQPIRTSKVDSEELQFNTVVPYTAPLFYVSDEDQDNSILYEDGIPVPNDQWRFNSSIEVEILSGFNPTATYVIDYNILTRVETPAIDIQSPLPNGNDTWFADYLVWNRHVSEISLIKDVVSVAFDEAFEFVLPRRSDRNKLKSTLTENTGITQRTVPQTLWSYVDSTTIRINGSAFNPNAVYSLEYNQQLVNPTRAVEITSEIRSANSVFNLNSATYIPFLINDTIDGNKRFHQIRLTFKEISNIVDLRVHSVLVKGINMTGSGSPPPGF